MTDSDCWILDTHIWIWWVKRDGRLPASLARQMANTSAVLAISSVSVYEATLQILRGRVEIDLSLEQWLHAATVESDIGILPVTAEIAAKAASLPLHHGDPLDRIIIATAVQHAARLVSVDGHFPRYEALQGRLIAVQE